MSEILHLVPLELRDDADAEQVEGAFAASRALADRIEGVLVAVAGEDVSPEAMADSYTHALVFRFADSQSRDRFLTHPEHIAAGELLKPLLKRAMVLEIEDPTACSVR
jgi:hypothetical protein